MRREEFEYVHADDLAARRLLGGARVRDVVLGDGFGWIQEGCYAGGVEGYVECGVVDYDELLRVSVRVAEDRR
jgi:hypothetical protein